MINLMFFGRAKIILALSLGLAFGVSLYGYATDDLHLITYTTSDWLINYQGGIVRRGLIGHLIFLATSSSSKTLGLMFALQVLVALFTLILILKIFFECATSVGWIIFLLSPGFFISYFLYDTHSALRKENLVFLAMALLVNGLSARRIQKIYLFLAIAVYGLAVFSHELACFCLPFLLYPIAMRGFQNISTKSLLQKTAMILSCLAIAGLVFAVMFKGNETVVRDICNSLIGRGLDPILCEYSIPFLASDPTQAWSYVFNQVRHRPYLPLYIICIVLGMLPFTLTNWLSLRSTRILIAAGAIGLSPLFITGIDWGRWIHIFIVLTTLCFFWYATQASVTLKRISTWLMVAFLSLWTLPAIVSRPNSILYPHVVFLPNLGLVDVAYRKWHEKPKVDPFKETLTVLLAPYQKILFYPLEQNSRMQHQYTQVALSRGKSTNASWLNFLGSSSRFSFLSKEDITKENQTIARDLESGQIDASALYVFSDPGSILKQLLPKFRNLENRGDALFYRDGVMILAPNWRQCSQCRAVNLPQQYALNVPTNIQINNPISFAHSRDGKNPLLAMGWNDFSEDWGTWSVAKSAQLLLPMPQGEPKRLRLIMRAYILGGPQNQHIRVMLDGQLMKTITLERFDNNEIEFELNPMITNKKFITLDFDIPDARSPHSVGAGDDRRSLGVGLQSATFYSN